MKVLESLLQSKARARILKLFFQNERESFTRREVANKIQCSFDAVERELEKLREMKILQKSKHKGKNIYYLNKNFVLYGELKSLVLRASPFSIKELSQIFRKISGLRLVVVSGVFFQEERVPIDILLVGNRIPKQKISSTIKKIEANVGKEIRWSLMSSEEFNYRAEIHDKFLKDVFDHPHKKVVDKIGLYEDALFLR